MIRKAAEAGRHDALAKFALGPPTQVDQFVADIEQGQDVPPSQAPVLPQDPSAALGMPEGAMPSLAGESTSPPTPPGVGSTVAPPR